MPRNKALSHEKIIRAAIDEFSEYGYDMASMRRIGERCGFTAAALYRHFDSKEAMFDALVRPAAEDLEEWLGTHSADSDTALDMIESGADKEAADIFWKSTEIDMMSDLIYPRMTEYAMLVNKSRGSKYENFLNDLVVNRQKKMMPQFDRLRGLGYEVKDISENELHMLLTAYFSALFEPVAHDYSLEEAIKYLRTVEAFFMPGWKNLMGFSGD